MLDRDAAYPKAGALSGMAVTWVTGAALFFVGVALPSLHPIFAGQPSTRLLNLLLVSLGIMTLHKIESYFTHEFDHCPVYLSLKSAAWAREPRQAVFVTFCSVFLALTLVIALSMRGSPWLLLLPGVWSAQGLHEIHHSAKSLSRRGYYPGTLTALVFVAFIDAFFFPEYFSLLRVEGRAALFAFYALQPLLFFAFFVEDRAWLRKLGERAPLLQLRQAA